MKNNTIDIAKDLLHDFQRSLKDRTLFNLLFPDGFFSNLLEWNFHFWKEERKLLDQGDAASDENFMRYHMAQGTTSEIVVDIFKRALVDKNGHEAYSLFADIKKHVDKHINEDKYLERLIARIAPHFFELIHASTERFDIWNHYFPNEWKIGLDSLKNNVPTRYWFKEFLDWAIPRIAAPIEKEDSFDNALEEVIRDLFPSLDPILWAQFLIFVLSSGSTDPAQRVKAAIERRWNFGLMSQIGIGDYSDDWEENFKMRQSNFESNTLEFARHFNERTRIFKVQDLPRFNQALEDLKKVYPPDSIEEGHRLRLIYLIQGLVRVHSQNQIKNDELVDPKASPFEKPFC